MIEAARELLAGAGLADGFTIDVTYPQVNVYCVDFSVMMQKVQQDLAELDIELNLQPVEFVQWVELMNGDEGIPMTAVYFARIDARSRGRV